MDSISIYNPCCYSYSIIINIFDYISKRENNFIYLL